MPWARASELDRLMACPAASHLPRLAVVSERAQEAGNWGTAMHALIESGETTKKYAGAQLRRLRAVGNLPGLRDLYPRTGQHEVTVSWEPGGWVEAPPLADREAREAWKAARPQDAVPGTADYMGDVCGEPWVDDLKTGRMVPEDPLDLAQLRFYASYLATVRGVPVLVSITHWPRYPADGAPRRIWGSRPWSPDDAVTFLNELEDARRRARRSASLPVADARPGPHCFFCPAQLRCPELVGGTASEVAQ